MSCEKKYEKRRVKLRERFGNAESGAVVEAEICPTCGVKVRSKQLGRNVEGLYMIPSALAEVVEES